MTEETDPGLAMARDAEMLAAAEAGKSSIRLYRWTAVCVTLGRFQRPEDALVDPSTTPWAHRPTGGAAVLHGHDVTLTVALPYRKRSRSIRDLYRHAAAMPIALLRTWGLDARLADDAAATRSGAYCFGSKSACDIVDASGRKVCGCALRVTRAGALLQTSIPVGQPSVSPSMVILGGEPLPIKAVDAGEIDLQHLGASLGLSYAEETFA